MNRRSFLSVATLSALSALLSQKSFAECCRVQNYKAAGSYKAACCVQDYKVAEPPSSAYLQEMKLQERARNGPSKPLYPSSPSSKSLHLPTSSPKQPVFKSPCPGGVCPRRIRLGRPWVETHLGYTTPQHLIKVHCFSPETVAAYTGRLNLLHGSPDAPCNPHSRG